MKVLIIDDEDDIRRVATLSLVKVGGMEVIGSASGEEGVSKAEQEMPDVILLDVMMPHVDGPSTLAKLRDNPQTANIPVIFLTAKAMTQEVEKLKRLGARGVLTKPFDPMTLPKDVKDLLSIG
jgi:CheY-like chemotaxis protein